MKKECTYKLASQLQDALNEAFEITNNERVVFGFLRNPHFAVSQLDAYLRRVACEVATTYDLIRHNIVDIKLDGYEFIVDLEFYEAPPQGDFLHTKSCEDKALRTTLTL